MPDRETLFELPTQPERFGVPLPSAELRRIDFSALEFEQLRRAAIEYIKTYYPDEFNDFVSNNGIIMLVELISYIGSIMSLRADILANEAFLPTAKTEDAVINHLALIGQKFKRQTPAQVDMQCSVELPVTADIRIPAGLSFTVPGTDGNSINYEIFRSPDDLISPIVIPAGKRGVIAYGIEGSTNNFSTVSEGTEDQHIIINDDNILEAPFRVQVSLGNTTEEWKQIDFIERADPDDKVYELQLFENQAIVRFGNNTTGEIPPSGSTINITYRVGGGTRGRIGSGAIDTVSPIIPDYPLKTPVPVNFRNPTPSVGGTDKESIEEAKQRAPRDFATQRAAVTASDYAQLASGFSHPVFGSVKKAMATIRTGKNANRVELYVLAEEAEGAPTTPNAGLRRALVSYLDEINVLTDHVVVLNAKIKPIDIDMNVTMSRNADGSLIRSSINAALKNFFNIDKWSLGEALYKSQLYQLIMDIDGIENVDILKPRDNILPSDKLAEESNGDGIVGINELITLGNQEIRTYYAKAR